MNHFTTYIENKLLLNEENTKDEYLAFLAVMFPRSVIEVIKNYPLTRRQRRELAKGVGRLGNPYYIDLVSKWYSELDDQINDFILVGLMETHNWILFNYYYRDSTPVISSHAVRLRLMKYISDKDPLKNLYGAMDGEHIDLFKSFMERYITLYDNKDVFLATLLNKAIKKDKFLFVRVLVEDYNAKFTQEDLNLAMKKASIELIKYIINKNNSLRIDLIPAVYNDRWQIVREILNTYNNVMLKSSFIAFASALNREDSITYRIVDNESTNMFNFAFLGSLASRNSDFTYYLKDLLNEKELKKFLTSINRTLRETSYSTKNPYLLYLSLLYGGYGKEALKVFKLRPNTDIPLVKAAAITGAEAILDLVINKTNADEALLYLSINNRSHLINKYLNIAFDSENYEKMALSLYYIVFFGHWEIADKIIDKLIEVKFKMNEILFQEIRGAYELTHRLEEAFKFEQLH